MDHPLNNFLGLFFRKAWTIFGARVKNGLFIKKGVTFKFSITKTMKFQSANFKWFSLKPILNMCVDFNFTMNAAAEREVITSSVSKYLVLQKNLQWHVIIHQISGVKMESVFQSRTHVISLMIVVITVMNQTRTDLCAVRLVEFVMIRYSD